MVGSIDRSALCQAPAKLEAGLTHHCEGHAARANLVVFTKRIGPRSTFENLLETLPQGCGALSQEGAGPVEGGLASFVELREHTVSVVTRDELPAEPAKYQVRLLRDGRLGNLVAQDP